MAKLNTAKVMNIILWNTDMGIFRKSYDEIG